MNPVRPPYAFAGTVGSGIVQRFLQDGASVIAPLRSPASKGRLTDHLTAPTDKLHTPVADWGTPEGAAALAQFIREQGLQVDHAVSIAGERCGVDLRRSHRQNRLRTSCSVPSRPLHRAIASTGLPPPSCAHVVSAPSPAGGMAAPGNVADITVASLAEAVQTKVAGHVLLAQALVPLMRQAPSSSFTLITGLLGEEGPSAACFRRRAAHRPSPWLCAHLHAPPHASLQARCALSPASR